MTHGLYQIHYQFDWLNQESFSRLQSQEIAQEPFTNIASPQELIVERKINDTDKSSKEYVYHKVGVQNEKDIEVLYPRTMFSQYCQAHGGRFTQTQKSSFSLVKDPWAKKLLRTYNSLKQGTGTFRCQLKIGGQTI